MKLSISWLKVNSIDLDAFTDTPSGRLFPISGRDRGRHFYAPTVLEVLLRDATSNEG